MAHVAESQWLSSWKPQITAQIPVAALKTAVYFYTWYGYILPS